MILFIFLLSFMFSTVSAMAPGSSRDGKNAQLTDEERTYILAQIKRENPNVSPHDTGWQRVQRNTAVLCNDPLGFYINADRSELLLKYVADRDLLLDGKPLSSTLSPQASITMSEAFADDQKEQIRLYRRAKRIPAHPGLQQIYYLVSICGIGGFTASYTPCYCAALQTSLGCYTT